LRGRFAKLRRDTRALSPIFAVLLLIAIAVIAGIIIYMYTSGYLSTMMGGGTAGQEKVAIQTVVVNSATSLIVYAKSTGGGDVAITDAILKDAGGNTVEVVSATATLLADGTMETVSITLTGMTSGQTYTITLVSQAGNQFVSPAFKA